MAKQILLIICSIISLSATIHQSEEKILWGIRDIEFTDFKGTPDMKVEDNARVCSRLELTTKYITRDSLVVYIQSVMIPEKSWTKTSAPNVLWHERRHFDITEVFSRKARLLISATSFKASNFSSELLKIHKKIEADLILEQKRYDFETDHSRNRDGQHQWDAKIQQGLVTLNGHARTVVPIKIDWKK